MIRAIVFVLTGRDGSIEPREFFVRFGLSINLQHSTLTRTAKGQVKASCVSSVAHLALEFYSFYRHLVCIYAICRDLAHYRCEKSVSQRVTTPWREVFYLLWMASVGAALGRGMGANSILYGLLGSMCLMSLALGSLTYFALNENDLGTSSQQFRITLSFVFCLIVSSLLLNQR